MPLDLKTLPDIQGFRLLAKSLAILDAILCPDWENRYYSFNSRWSKDAMMASMRNGSGSLWFALLCPAGVALQGLALDAATYRSAGPAPEVFSHLPPEFQQNFLKEPAFQCQFSTFCLWRRSHDSSWQQGPVQLPAGQDPDGSIELLSILQGDPSQYQRFAEEYYEQEIDLADIKAIYAHRPLTNEFVARLNPEISLKELHDDLSEIGYPEN
jgi:hypothetical protein